MLPQDIEKLKQAFGDREFAGKDVARVLEMRTWHGSGAALKGLRRKGLIYATANGYRFGTPLVIQGDLVNAPSPRVSTPAPVCHSPSVMRIGELYLHERMLLIADTARQDTSAALRIYTTIIEVDPATKHPRNKIINFIKARDPREYAQAMTWLDSMAGVPPQDVDETALELAAELERKLSAANQEIAELKAKLEAIRGMIRGDL